MASYKEQALQAGAAIRLELERRFGLFEQAWAQDDYELREDLREAMRAEVRGSVAASIETIAEWCASQCMYKQRGLPCQEKLNGNSCMAEVMADLVRGMKPK